MGLKATEPQRTPRKKQLPVLFRSPVVNLLCHNPCPEETKKPHKQDKIGANMSQEKNTIKEYDAILKEVRELMVAKNADYGDSWREMRLPSITDQILVKTYRIRSIEESEGAPKVSEGVESEYRDILNYCVFALIKLRDEKMA